MLLFISCLAILASLSSAKSLEFDKCHILLLKEGFSSNFNETIAHAIHSMNLEALRMFNPGAGEDNHVPTVNHDLRQKNKVLSHAPSDKMEDDFSTAPMNMIDKILSNLGNPDDGLGPNWSPIERVAHAFHMWDLWMKIYKVYQNEIPQKPDSQICNCLLNVETNGIKKAVQWVADHYEKGTPITLLNRPIPKLKNSEAWKVWKNRLLFYYTPEALVDAARYLQCTQLQN